ncbi:MAG: hypothetical protein EHM91_03845, partial [Planctomycetota bacterium]
MLSFLAAEGGAHEPPHSIFTWLWHRVKDTPIGKFYRFNDEHLGQFWFDAIAFSLIASAILLILASTATKQYNRVPRGIQNVFEWIVGLLRGMVQGFIPAPQADRYLPYLGSLFLFIFTM